MKVILLKDVAKVGLKDEIKDVSSGYAQNFLIQRGLAEAATAGKIAQIEKNVAGRIAQQEERKGALEEGLAKLKGKGLVIRATANEKEYLFEAVSADVIATHLTGIIGVDVAAENIQIKSPIKELGEHTVNVRVGDAHVGVILKVENT